MGVWAKSFERLKLEPTFGVKSWSTERTCADVHPRGPMPADTRLCCMCCHCSGEQSEKHPDLTVTAIDTLAVQSFEPEGGKDAWSPVEDLTGTEKPIPTRYAGKAKAVAPKTRKQKRLEINDRGQMVTISPDAIRRAVDDDRAFPVGRSFYGDSDR